MVDECYEPCLLQETVRADMMKPFSGVLHQCQQHFRGQRKTRCYSWVYTGYTSFTILTVQSCSPISIGYCNGCPWWLLLAARCPNLPQPNCNGPTSRCIQVPSKDDPEPQVRSLECCNSISTSPLVICDSSNFNIFQTLRYLNPSRVVRLTSNEDRPLTSVFNKQMGAAKICSQGPTVSSVHPN